MPDPSAARPPIQIGDRLITVEEPNGWKFLRATELIAEISAGVPELQSRSEEFVREYRARGSTRVEKAIARTQYPPERYPDGIGAQNDEWWEQRGGVVIFPGPPPTGFEQGMAMFTHILKVAKEPAVELVAVLSAPDGELADADRARNLDSYLDDWKRTLLHGGKISSLAMILVRSLEAMRAEFAADGEAAAAMGEIRSFFAGSNPGTPTQPPPSDTADQPSTSADPSTSTPESDGDATRPPSSTASPAPTDGPVTTSSTDHPGVSSATSPPASAIAS